MSVLFNGFYPKHIVSLMDLKGFGICLSEKRTIRAERGSRESDYLVRYSRRKLFESHRNRSSRWWISFLWVKMFLAPDAMTLTTVGSVYVTMIFQTRWHRGLPLLEVLPWLDRACDAFPEMQKIWEYNPNYLDMNHQFRQLKYFYRGVVEGLLSGTHTLNSPTYKSLVLYTIWVTRLTSPSLKRSYPYHSITICSPPISDCTNS